MLPQSFTRKKRQSRVFKSSNSRHWLLRPHCEPEGRIYSTNLRTVDGKSVRDPKGNFTAVEGIGDVPITVELKDGKTTELILRNVLYVPNYKVNLLSVNKAVNFDHRFIFNDSRARMVLSDGREIHLTKNSCLFFLKVTYLNTVNPSTCNETRQSIKGDIDLWHKRLGHLNKVDVKRTVGCGGDTKDRGGSRGRQISRATEVKITHLKKFDPTFTSNYSGKQIELIKVFES